MGKSNHLPPLSLLNSIVHDLRLFVVFFPTIWAIGYGWVEGQLFTAVIASWCVCWAALPKGLRAFVNSRQGVIDEIVAVVIAHLSSPLPSHHLHHLNSQ